MIESFDPTRRGGRCPPPLRVGLNGVERRRWRLRLDELAIASRLTVEAGASGVVCSEAGASEQVREISLLCIVRRQAIGGSF